MKKEFASACILLAFVLFGIHVACPSAAHSGERHSQRLKKAGHKMAVLPLVCEGSLSEPEAALLTERLYEELRSYDLFECLSPFHVERELLRNDVNPFVCASIESGIQAGRKLGAQIIVNGKIERGGTSCLIDLRMVHVRSGEIVHTVHEYFDGSSSELNEYFTLVAKKLIGMEAGKNGVSRHGAYAALGPVAIPSESEQAPSDPNMKKSHKRHWPLLGLLAAGGIGLSVYLMQQNNVDDPTQTIAPPLSQMPAPPTFP